MTVTISYSYGDYVHPEKANAPNFGLQRHWAMEMENIVTSEKVIFAVKTKVQLDAIAVATPAPTEGETYFCTDGAAGSPIVCTWSTSSAAFLRSDTGTAISTS